MKKQWLRKIGLILLSVFVLSLLVFVMSRLAPGIRWFLIMENVRRECRWKNMSMQWNDLD